MSRTEFILAALLVIMYTDNRQKAPQVLSRDLISFFAGDWYGEGEFANGKKITADVSFRVSLDSCWLTYEHADRLPNRYKSLSVWGADKATGEFIAWSFDNFSGHREWTGRGWDSGKLLLSIHSCNPVADIVAERFIYEKLSANTFKLTYEAARDGIHWREGDHLIFTRK